MGGHVVKTGMSPIIIDLMEKNILTLLSMNGSGIIHDLEIAMVGRTSEDVAQSLGNGKGYSLVGHHEILIPLIAAGVIESL